MPAQLNKIRQQIAALEKKALELTRAANQKVVDRVKALIDKHGLTAADLGFGDAPGPKASTSAGKNRKRAKAAAGEAKYRDPETGKTWTGRGKPPTWIAGAADRTAFLIDAKPAPAPAAPKKARRAAKPAPATTTKPLAQQAGKKATARKTTAAPAPKKTKKARAAATAEASPARPSASRRASQTKRAPTKRAKARVSTPAAEAPLSPAVGEAS